MINSVSCLFEQQFVYVSTCLDIFWNRDTSISNDRLDSSIKHGQVPAHCTAPEEAHPLRTIKKRSPAVDTEVPGSVRTLGEFSVSADRLLVWAVALAAVLVASFHISDSDLFMHLRNGERMLESGRLEKSEVYSYTSTES